MYKLGLEKAEEQEINGQHFLGAFLVAQLVKNPPAIQEIPVQFLGWEDPLEKGWAIHSSILGNIIQC